MFYGLPGLYAFVQNLIKYVTQAFHYIKTKSVLFFKVHNYFWIILIEYIVLLWCAVLI